MTSNEVELSIIIDMERYLAIERVSRVSSLVFSKEMSHLETFSVLPWLYLFYEFSDVEQGMCVFMSFYDN